MLSIHLNHTYKFYLRDKILFQQESLKYSFHNYFRELFKNILKN